MNEKIESLYKTIGTKLHSAIKIAKWEYLRYTIDLIERYSGSSGYVLSDEGKRVGLHTEGGLEDDLLALRTEMAKLNPEKGAWYSATFTLTPDGKYKFDFEYDRLPAFDIIPSPDKWLEEFNLYPRPELQTIVQDWIDQKVDYKVVVKRLKDLHDSAQK